MWAGGYGHAGELRPTVRMLRTHQNRQPNIRVSEVVRSLYHRYLAYGG